MSGIDYIVEQVLGEGPTYNSVKFEIVFLSYQACTRCPQTTPKCVHPPPIKAPSAGVGKEGRADTHDRAIINRIENRSLKASLSALPLRKHQPFLDTFLATMLWCPPIYVYSSRKIHPGCRVKRLHLLFNLCFAESRPTAVLLARLVHPCGYPLHRS